jgi:hypothetical protein
MVRQRRGQRSSPGGNMPAPDIARLEMLGVELLRNQSCSFCREEKDPPFLNLRARFNAWFAATPSAYVVGGLCGYWICDRCVRSALQTLSNMGPHPASEAITRCSFCDKEKRAGDSFTNRAASICEHCLRQINLAFQNPVVPPG